jgi:hypothetical protein
MSRREGRETSAFTLVAGGALLLAMSCLALYDALFHECWRDEAHAVLIAAHAPLHRFFLSMRLEGVPFLFQFLLKLSSFVLPPRAGLLLGGVLGYGALLFGTYRCLESVAGQLFFPWSHKCRRAL